MRGGVKALIGVVVVLAFIGLRAYNGTPKWREAIKESQTIPEGKAFIQFFSLKSKSKLRLTVTEKKKRPLFVYWLAKNDSDSLQSGAPKLERLAKRIPAQTLCDAGNLVQPKEFELMNGDFSIYFEAAPTEDETDKEPYRIQYTIEEYR